MKCPNIGKFVNCKGELTIKIEDDGAMYYHCSSCGYQHIKYAELKREIVSNLASVDAFDTE